MGSIYCQEISGTVIDSLNKQPIPFAAITSNFNNNAITNEEGKFKIYKDSSFTIEDSIFISSIGFAPGVTCDKASSFALGLWLCSTAFCMFGFSFSRCICCLCDNAAQR